ncbi:SHOCT domain-containing protein [Halobellus rufus]|uniref:SHOCT domain-containing protein n=1 Tax=Halobellus rufus TaxID=1448860 RepID=UPI0006799D1A|nr:SHOCT domain-containing protein [Halobellus rufus]
MTEQRTSIRTTGLKIGLLALSALIGASGTVVAQGGGGMMGSGWGSMGGFGVFPGGMFLGPVLLIGLILALVYGVSRGTESEQRDTALSKLRERYARGEITDEEFEERRRRLEEP